MKKRYNRYPPAPLDYYHDDAENSDSFIDIMDDDDALEKYIEQQRILFYAEWFLYIEENEW